MVEKPASCLKNTMLYDSQLVYYNIDFQICQGVLTNFFYYSDSLAINSSSDIVPPVDRCE